MTNAGQGPPDHPTSPDAWTWWQARRLRYNLALAAAGWIAYGSTFGLYYMFGRSMWADFRGGLSATLLLGVAFLVVMGVANVCYLLGPAIEVWLRPSNPTHFRETAYRMGFWGSIAAPFAFPALNLVLLISTPA